MYPKNKLLLSPAEVLCETDFFVFFLIFSEMYCLCVNPYTLQYGKAILFFPRNSETAAQCFMGEQRAPVGHEESEHGYSGALEEKDCLRKKEDGEPCGGLLSHN